VPAAATALAKKLVDRVLVAQALSEALKRNATLTLLE
jgi:hypothetical protein